MNHLKEPKPRPKDIVYQEDRIRRQFFKDFPFEALRPVSLVEGTHINEGTKEGVEWTSLEQRGAYPTVEE
jgi:small subunit ribosomal protein S23